MTAPPPVPSVPYKKWKTRGGGLTDRLCACKQIKDTARKIGKEKTKKKKENEEHFRKKEPPKIGTNPTPQAETHRGA